MGFIERGQCEFDLQVFFFSKVQGTEQLAHAEVQCARDIGGVSQGHSLFFPSSISMDQVHPYDEPLFPHMYALVKIRKETMVIMGDRNITGHRNGKTILVGQQGPLEICGWRKCSK